MSERHRVSDLVVLRRLLLGLVVLFGGLYLAAHVYTVDRVPRGTSVDGVRVGGLTTASATRILQSSLADRAAAPIRVGAGGQVASIDPVTSGLRVDVPATVARIGTADGWALRDLWRWADGGRSHAAVVTVDPAALSAAVDRFAARVDDPAVPGAVTFSDGQAAAQYPVTGSLLDRPAAAATLRRAFLHHDEGAGVLALPTVADRSAVGKQEVSRAMEQFANPAVSGAVTLRLGGERVRLQPDEFGPALSMRADGSRLVPVLDDAALLEVVGPRMEKLARAPRDATVAVVGGRLVVTPARAGLTFRPADVTGGFLAALTRPDRTLTVTGVRAEPSVSTADVGALGITERVSTFQTHFPYAAYRNVNLPRAAQLIDGTVVRPGGTFSLNRTVGQRTAANGFTQGYIIDGGVFRKDFGGGVSQVATTTFNAAFFAGMQDVEHKAHSFYISRYPVGREATVVWPDVDLRFRDTTPYAVLVSASVQRATPSRPGTVRVSLWSTKYWDVSTTTGRREDLTAPRTRRLSGPGCVANTGYDGFQIDVERVLRRHGSSAVAHRETMHTTYTPSDTVICD